VLLYTTITLIVLKSFAYKSHTEKNKLYNFVYYNLMHGCGYFIL